MTNLGKKEREAFEEFENKILSLKGEQVTYRQDTEIESAIKKQVLFENFGEDACTELIEKLGLNFLDLANQSTFVEIYNFLSENKKNE